MRDILYYFQDSLRFLSFLIFVALGFVLLRPSEPITRRKRLNRFLIYFLLVSGIVGVSQRDDWPFSPYPLMRGVWSGSFLYHKITPIAVDAGGQEWEVDSRTWSPIFPLVLQEWFNDTYPLLSQDGRSTALRFLLARAEATRRRQITGARIGNDTLLGPLTAPDWWLYRRVSVFSPNRYVAIRIYRDSWRPAEKIADPTRFVRKLVGDYAGAR
jgi:hypothetical protein